MTRTIFWTLLLLTATATLVGPVAAQDPNNTTELNETADLDPDDLDEDARVYIDGNAYVTDWEHDGDTHRVTVGADSDDTTIFLLPVIDTDEDTSGSYSGTSVTVEAGNERTRTIESEDTIIAMTMDSLGDVEFVQLDPENDVLIGGPWTVRDARLSAVGAGLAMASMVSIKELKRRLGAGLEPEWLR